MVDNEHDLTLNFNGGGSHIFIECLMIQK